MLNMQSKRQVEPKIHLGGWRLMDKLWSAEHTELSE